MYFWNFTFPPPSFETGASHSPIAEREYTVGWNGDNPGAISQRNVVGTPIVVGGPEQVVGCDGAV